MNLILIFIGVGLIVGAFVSAWAMWKVIEKVEKEKKEKKINHQ